MIPVLRHKLPSLARVAGAACVPIVTSAYRRRPLTTVVVGLTGTAGLAAAAYAYGPLRAPARPNPPPAPPIPVPLQTHRHQGSGAPATAQQQQQQTKPQEDRRLRGLPAV